MSRRCLLTSITREIFSIERNNYTYVFYCQKVKPLCVYVHVIRLCEGKKWIMIRLKRDCDAHRIFTVVLSLFEDEQPAGKINHNQLCITCS